MTRFEETAARVRSAAKAVLQDDSAADQFLRDLEGEWGHLRHQVLHRRRKAKVLGPGHPEGREKSPLRRDVPSPFLEAAAALSKFRQYLADGQDGQDGQTGATWPAFSSSRKSRAWKKLRHVYPAEEGARVAAARRRQLVAWVQHAVLVRGGGLLTFSDSADAERPTAKRPTGKRTTGVELMLAVLEHLEIGGVSAYVVARDLRAVRRQARVWQQQGLGVPPSEGQLVHGGPTACTVGEAASRLAASGDKEPVELATVLKVPIGMVLVKAEVFGALNLPAPTPHVAAYYDCGRHDDRERREPPKTLCPTCAALLSEDAEGRVGGRVAFAAHIKALMRYARRSDPITC